jgi:DNA-binding transcriptional regulator YiaG
MDYSAILKTIREKLMISQEDLAKLLNVSYVSVNRWENEHHKPGYETRRKMAELCKKNGIEMKP